MPWPFDNQGGDPIVEGLLASQKYQLLQEELQQSRLQRAEYEAGLQSRTMLRDLALQREQQELKTSRTRDGLTELQKQLAQVDLETLRQTQPSTVATSKNNARRSGLEADAAEFGLAEAKKNSPLARRKLAGEVVGQELSNTGRAIANTVGGLGLAQGLASSELSPAEVMALAGHAQTLVGSPDKSGAFQAMFAANLNAQIESSKNEVKANQSSIQQQRTLALAQILQGGPAAVEAALATNEFPELRPGLEAIASRADFGRTPRLDESSFDKAFSEALVKRYTTTQDKLLELDTQIEVARQEEDSDGYFDGRKSTKTKKRKDLELQRTKLQGLLTQIQSEMEAKSAGKSSQASDPTPGPRYDKETVAKAFAEAKKLFPELPEDHPKVVQKAREIAAEMSGR